MRYVCDTVVFITGFVGQLKGELITTPEVEKEIKSSTARCFFELAKGKGLKVLPASKDFLKYVRKKTIESGDIIALSETDISLLAKALETKAVLVSDDFDLQNVCLKLGVKFMPVLRSVKKRRDWVYKCPACKRVIKIKNGKMICPVCGTILTTS